MYSLSPKAFEAVDTTNRSAQGRRLLTQLMGKDLRDTWATKQRVHAQVLKNLDFFPPEIKLVVRCPLH